MVLAAQTMERQSLDDDFIYTQKIIIYIERV